MGKMKLNLDELENPTAGIIVESGKAVGSITTPIANAVKETSLGKYSAQKEMYAANQHSVQVKLDMVSNIVADACGLANNITNTIREICVEKEKTKQVQSVAKAHVNMAKEQTKQVAVQEKEATKRFYAECLRDVEIARTELKKRQSELAVERERILSDERKFNSIFELVLARIKDLDKINNRLAEQGEFSEVFYKNQAMIDSCIQKLADMYISTRGSK